MKKIVLLLATLSALLMVTPAVGAGRTNWRARAIRLTHDNRLLVRELGATRQALSQANSTAAASQQQENFLRTRVVSLTTRVWQLEAQLQH